MKRYGLRVKRVAFHPSDQIISLHMYTFMYLKNYKEVFILDPA